jgi:hypothetical protein
MELKKGLFFTIDGMLAASVILVTIVFISSGYVEDQPNFELDYLSQDVLSILSDITVEDSDSEYIKELITAGTIESSSNTLLEQIVEFWVDDDFINANKSTSNVTDLFVPQTHGFGLWIDGEVIYARDAPIKQSLISSKKIVTGVAKGQTTGITRNNPPELLGPIVVEVRVWK